MLAGSTPAWAQTVSRGPYLQQGTSTSVIVRWRTNTATASRVRYGTAPGALGSFADGPGVSTEHVVALTGLSPDTTYYYSVGTPTAQLAGDATYFFVTSPVPGTAKPTRIWVLGDSGSANSYARAVRDAYYGFVGNARTDLWLMLGDNAYTNGTDSEYQAAVFDMYPGMLRKSVLWSTLGNHDGYSADSASQSGPYYDIFTLPTNGEAGGAPSGTEAYYSFDYGNIHFICLDSYGTSRSSTGAMATWVQDDVASTMAEWVIAFWHHPPYSKGSHNSDTESELIQMRQNFLPILESAGIDMVLTGHSHSYERSFLINGHYGSSGTFNDSFKKDGGSGRENETGAYMKSPGTAANDGAVYVVAGSSGQTSGGSLNHPAMFISMNNLGSMVLDVDGGRLDARFLRENGMIADRFTIAKGPMPLTLTSPNGGETWTPGLTAMVGWSGGQSVSSVTLRLSVDGGATYPFVLASSVPNSGSATVNVPSVTTSQARVRISAASDDAVADASNADFTIDNVSVATFVAPKSTWKVNDQGQDLGTAWRGASFNDTAWSNGAGVLGYGESYIDTPVSFGPSSANKHPTTYFRKTFQGVDPAQALSLTLRVMVDDGFVATLNGTEIARGSMPAGVVAYTTPASGHEANNTYEIFDVGASKSLLVNGTNVLAVEVHQSDGSSSDLVFDAELSGQIRTAAISGGGGSPPPGPSRSGKRCGLLGVEALLVLALFWRRARMSE
ncbi:MAG: metallophosphoesterase [Planctomycetes bacterium]|nr:metallophosphoesterase [Planctomycetota bacterium]